ncbi:MAG TPA: aminotransferase class III-fold pyridoxal phosphate-dependent enzyme [Steroidobacteraceae bacterium]
MTRSLANSNAQFRKAVRRLPLGVSSNFRYWGDDKTIYVKSARGARLTDIDDNEYIDYRMAYGPCILGYADPRVDAAARAGMEIGGVFALSTERECAVAERIANMVPAAELVRFSNSGTEAVMAALRLARAVTGKDSYVVVEGGYHGVFDAALWTTPIEDWRPALGEPHLVPYSKGVPGILRALLHAVPMNDADRLESVFKAYGHEIAAFLIEPIMGNCCSISATRDYLRDARALCDRYGILMVIDEVKTGFRVARGGVQELFGVKADLCTFAKAMANGYPISVLCGREAIMRKIGDGVVHGGTFTCHSVALAAADKTLEILGETPALQTIAEYGTKLRAGMSQILSQRGIKHSFSGHPSMSGLFFSEKPPHDYRDWATSDYTFYEALAPQLHDLGVLCEPDSREPWFVCEAHDERCLGETLERFETAVDRVVRSAPGTTGARSTQ